MTLTKPSTNGRPPSRSLYKTVMGVVIPLVVGMFTLIGVLFVLQLRAGAVIGALNQQEADVAAFTNDVNARIDRWRNSVRAIATGAPARNFARDTLVAVSGSFNNSQERLLGEFTLLREANPAFREVFYGTFDGAIWTRIDFTTGTPVIDRQEQVNVLRDEPLFQQALLSAPGEVTLSGLIFDDAGRPLVIAASPVVPQDEALNVAGAIMVVIDARDLLDSTIASARLLTGSAPQRTVLVVDQEGRVVYNSAVVSPNTTLNALAAGNPARLDVLLPDVSRALQEARRNDTTLSADPIADFAVSSGVAVFDPVLNFRWDLLILDPASAFSADVSFVDVLIVGAALALGAGISYVIGRTLRRALRPVEAANRAAQILTDSTRKPTETTLGIPDATSEFNNLIDALRQLSEVNDDARERLDSERRRDERRFALVERLNRELSGTQRRDIDTLIDRTLSLLCNEYRYPHAQLYLSDDIGENLILLYSHGAIGAALLATADKESIATGDSIAARAARTQRVQLADPLWLRAPLDSVRAVIAAPMRYGSQVVGVLEVFSDAAGSFNDSDLRLFQLLADQIASTQQSVSQQLFLEERIEQVDILNRQLTRMAWESTSGDDTDTTSNAYTYDLLRVTPGEGEAGAGVSIPIAIRGQVVGAIDAALPDGTRLTNGDQALLRAVADRVGVAIENARLFNETRTNLTETYTLYQLSRYLGDAQTLEEIIQAVVSSVTPDAIAGQVAVFDDYAAGAMPTWMEVTAEWLLDEEDGRGVGFRGLQLQLSDHPLFASMTGQAPLVVNDVKRDMRIDPVLGAIIDTIGGQALIIIPFNARGRWRGLLVIHFPQPRTFDEREGRLFTAMIDQAGVSIDNRLLLTENEMTLEEIERLYTASRYINMSQTPLELVSAATRSATDDDLDFELGILEGAIDATGWPTDIRIAARSDRGELTTSDVVLSFPAPIESPLRRREPLIVQTRADDDSPVNLYLRERGKRFGAIFPLYSANQPIALFFVLSEQPRDLSSDDLDIYRALTGQMSTVLQNRRLLEQTEAILDETRRLYAASRAIAAATDSSGIFSAAINSIAAASTAITRVSVLLAHPAPSLNSPFWRIADLWARDSSGTTDLIAGRILANEIVDFNALVDDYEGTVVISDLRRQLRAYPGLRAILERGGTRSAIIVPVRTRLAWYGVIAVESLVDRSLDDRFGNFAQAVGDQMATALEGLRLFEEAQAQARRALALAEAGQFVARMSGDFASSINEVFENVAAAADYDRWVLVLANADMTQLEIVAQQLPGVPPLIEGETEFYDVANDHLPLVEAFRARQSLLVNAPEHYPALRDLPQALRAQFGKHFATPIRIGETLLGALMVGRPLESSDLDENDEELVQTLAAQVAVAVENRRLFETTAANNARLSSLLNSLPVGVIVLDPLTRRPVQFNQQAARLLDGVREDVAFSAAAYNLRMTGSTDETFPEDLLPSEVALVRGELISADNITIDYRDGTTLDLLINAVPIRDARGTPTALIVALQDISALRALERSLEVNLRESVQLYEMSRSLAEAADSDAVLDQALMQFEEADIADVYALLLNERDSSLQITRSLSGIRGAHPLPDSVFLPDQLVFVSDSAHDSRLSADERAALVAAGIAALIVVPLRSQSRGDVPIGWMALVFDTPRPDIYEREQFLTTFSEGVSLALDNRYLLRSTEDALRDTAALYAATSDISQARGIDDIARVTRFAISRLAPDFYAAYVSIPGTPMRELFNIAKTGDPLPFAEVLGEDGIGRLRTSLIDDLQGLQTPNVFERALQADSTIRSLAIIPLRAQGEQRGCLIAAYRAPHAFTSSEARYLNSLADSTSIVLDNALLLDRIQATLSETSALYLASRELTNATTPQDILRIAVEQIINPAVVQAFIVTLNRDGWELPGRVATIISGWTRSGDVLDLTGISFIPDQFPAWSLLGTELVLYIDDLEREARFDAEILNSLRGLGVRALAILPLRIARQGIGALVIGAQTPAPFSDSDLRVYQSFSEQASLRLEATRLVEQTERRARQLATSAEVSRIAGSILDLNFLLPRIVDLIKDAFGYDHAQVFLMDNDDDFAELRASTGDAGRKLLSLRHKLQKGSRSVIGQVTATAEPVIASDTTDARVVHRPNQYLPNTRSEMAIPLKLKGRVVGALDVQSNQPNAFDDDDVAVLTTLAAQISVAIDNAQLFDRSRRRANEMSFLFSVTTAAAAAETLVDALQSVAISLQDTLGALSVIIYLPKTYADSTAQTTFIQIEPVARSGDDRVLEVDLQGIRLDIDDGTIAAAARQRRARLLTNLEAETGYLPVTPSARSAIVVPLTSSGGLIGLITAEGAQPDSFDDEVMTLLLTLSGSLSAIIQSQQLLEQLQRSNEQLVELDRLKSEFLANMSHELRTPLNSIIGFSRVILKGIDGPLTEMQEQDLSTIYNSGMHLLNLINDILDQAKIQAGKMDLQYAHFDVKAVVDGVRSIGIGLVKDKPIAIHLEVAPGLPQAYGDEFRTRQVLLNLVSNAAKFTNEGTITIRAYPHYDEELGFDTVRIDVTDSGIGIAAKDIPLLFEEFRQVDSSLTRTQGGTGLGLPIAKSLMEMQGGRIGVRSVVNVGSTFSVFLPIDSVVPDTGSLKAPDTGSLRQTEPLAPRGDVGITTEIVETPQPRATNGVTGTLSLPNALLDTQETRDSLASAPMPVKRQLLLIEDNPDMVDQFRRALQREGFDIFTASIPLEAEAMASGLHPTVIVMDVNFAKGAGWDILGKLKTRDDTNDIPVIIVTLSSEETRARELGAFRFIARPFTPEDLVDAVRDAERDSRVERILIIDDQPEHARLLAQLLSMSGSYRVFSAASGSEGIALVARRRPNLVIVDLRMPDMDGFQVIQELRSNPETATIPILIVTGEEINANERQQLADLAVLNKAEISIDDYRRFVDGVKSHLAGD